MKLPEVVVVDFETTPILLRPDYPPKPVGVSIKAPGEKKATYYAWGHPVENNCSIDDGIKALKKWWRPSNLLLFHNAKFDYDVGTTFLRLPELPWESIHDTLYLLFLYNPHALSLSLKPAANAILGMAPEEQEAVRDWLVDHNIVRKNDKHWGAHIADAPGKLVGAYANGDVVRTERLFRKLYPDIVKRGMLPAYNRERELMPILLENEREGVHVNITKLEKDVAKYEKSMDLADQWLRKRLKVKDLNLDADKDVAAALKKSKVVTDFAKTKTGRDSVSKKNLTVDKFKDKDVAAVLGYRNALNTCLGTFMKNWLNRAEKGVIYTTWNQVRQSHGDDGMAGARTGRMSNTPPLMNIPKEFKKEIQKPGVVKVKALPFVRVYLTGDGENHVWLRRDYNQQEFRILAHYEDDGLFEAYKKNPRLDVHQWLKENLDAVGLVLERKDIKIANFAEVYGRGLGNQAAALKVPVETIKRINNEKAKLMPGLPRLKQDIKNLVKIGEPIKTWGGRQYYVEQSRYNEEQGRWMDFTYKLLNYLIQGSAADCTKQAIIAYHNHPKRKGRFLVAVHDEIGVSVHRKLAKSEMGVLRESMLSPEFDVPMLSDGEIGSNWYDLEDEDAWTIAKSAA